MHFRRPKVERMVNNINNIRLKLNNKSKVYYFENMMMNDLTYPAKKET